MYIIKKKEGNQIIIPALAVFFEEKIIMPHSNDHAKTKEGYLLEVEERLGLSENLPKQFYRLKINEAESLLDSVIVSGRSGFIFFCEENKIKTDGIFKNE